MGLKLTSTVEEFAKASPRDLINLTYELYSEGKQIPQELFISCLMKLIIKVENITENKLNDEMIEKIALNDLLSFPRF